VLATFSTANNDNEKGKAVTMSEARSVDLLPKDNAILRILKAINSVSLLSYRDDDGRTIIDIPAWVAASVILLLILFVQSKRMQKA
jgi:hypothetical protein